MAVYTLNFTTTAVQDRRLLQFLMSINDAQSAAGASLFLTVTDYFSSVFLSAVRSYVQQRTAQEANDVCVAYLSAMASVQSNVRTLLGVT